jgi:hypothetical protein
MSGIMVAAQGGSGIVYQSGLYGPSGRDLPPIDSSGNSPLLVTRTWIGYYLPSSSMSTNFSVTATWNSSYDDGTQYSRGYLWLGNLAKLGWTTIPPNSNVTADNGTASANVSVTAGVFYPIRIIWETRLTSGNQPFFPFNAYTTSGTFSTSITNNNTAYYYNSATNGF